MALLEIDDIHVFYDNIEALKGVSIKVERGISRSQRVPHFARLSGVRPLDDEAPLRDYSDRAMLGRSEYPCMR